MNLTLLKGYNNYFDRIVKKELLYDEYLDKSENYYTIQNINFIPNDGVNTEQVINWKENWTPDYLLITDEDENIISRWFVLDAIRTRGKQFRLELRRDVIADELEYIKDAPIYVEKGTLQVNDPLIYNDENMEFNQIKTDELLLKDKSKCAWLVGYYTKKHEKKTFHYKDNALEQPIKYEDLTVKEKYYYDRSKGFITGTVIGPDGRPIQSTVYKTWHFPTSKVKHYELNFYYGINHIKADLFRTLTIKYIFESEKYRKVVNSEDVVTSLDQKKLCYDARAKYNYFDSSAQAMNLRDTYSMDYFVKPFSNSILLYTNIPIGDTRQDIILKDNKFLDEIKSLSDSSFDEQINSEEIQIIQELSKKLILESDGTFHKLIINRRNNLRRKCYVGDSLYNYIISKTGNGRNPDTEYDVEYAYINTFRDNIVLENKIVSQSDGSTFYITFDDIEQSSTKTKNHGESDMTYDIFYLPYTDNLYLYDSLYKKYKKLKYNKNIALGIATSILSQSGGTGSSSTLCYDVQLLPYCPDKEYSFLNTDKCTDNDTYITEGISSSYFNPTLNSNLVDFIKCREGQIDNPATDKVEGILFWALKAASERNIFIDNKPDWLNVNYDAINKKIQNSCDFIRLCSPNYSGLYDMNVVKNEGIDFFNIDMVLKPFNPYIHINPNFKGLYYKDYNDSRGLICGGDFSIGSTSDAWTQYELNNKNYQQMFDREISNMDKTHSIEKTKNIISATSGAITGAISGAGMGFMMGKGPIGAAIGGITAGVAGVVGGVSDTILNEQQYKENRSFKTDMYNMSLQNIKAQPTSLAKVSTLTNNNKIWPFVEYYTCTDEEKNAFRNKIIYNGMTIMKIDTLNNYISEPNKTKFFKGQLIRCEKLHDDAHIKNSIYKELNEGVFL